MDPVLRTLQLFRKCTHLLSRILQCLKLTSETAVQDPLCHSPLPTQNSRNWGMLQEGQVAAHDSKGPACMAPVL